MASKDVFSSQASHGVSMGVGTRVQGSKLVERIGALCAAQRRKKKKRRKA